MEKVWEIQAIRGNWIGEHRIYYNLEDNGKLWRDGRDGHIDIPDSSFTEFRALQILKDSKTDPTIYAVKRISDGTIFSIGDEVKYPSESKGFIIKEIEELSCGSIKLSSDGPRYVTSKAIVGDFKKVGVIKREATDNKIEMVEFEW